MNLGAGEVGLLIVYLFQLFDLFQWGVVLSVYVETLVNLLIILFLIINPNNKLIKYLIILR